MEKPPQIAKRPPKLKHYNTPDPEELAQIVKKKKNEKIQSFEGKVKKSDIDNFQYDDMPKQRKSISGENAKTKLPSINENNKIFANKHDKISRNVIGANEKSSQKQSETGGHEDCKSHLPSISDSQPSMRYKHGVIPKAKKKKVAVVQNKAPTDGSTIADSGFESDSRILSGLEEGSTVSDNISRRGEIYSSGRGTSHSMCAECHRTDAMHEDWCPILRGIPNRSLTSGHLSSVFHKEHSMETRTDSKGKKLSVDSISGTWVNHLRMSEPDRATPESYLEHLEKANNVGIINDGNKRLKKIRNAPSGFKLTNSVTIAEPEDDKDERNSHENTYVSRSHGLPLFPNAVRDAYVKALGAAQRKILPHDPWMLQQRISRPFKFSYFENIPIPWDDDTPSWKKKDPLKIKKGQEMKHIFKDINVDDYYPGGKKNPINNKELELELEKAYDEYTPRKKKKAKRKGGISPLPRPDTSLTNVSTHSHSSRLVVP